MMSRKEKIERIVSAILNSPKSTLIISGQGRRITLGDYSITSGGFHCPARNRWILELLLSNGETCVNLEVDDFAEYRNCINKMLEAGKWIREPNEWKEFDLDLAMKQIGELA